LSFYFPFSFHQKNLKYYPRSDCGWQRQSKFWSLSYIVRLFLASWPHLFLVKTHPTTFEHGEKFVLVYIILLLLELVRWLRWFMYISYAMNGTHAQGPHTDTPHPHSTDTDTHTMGQKFLSWIQVGTPQCMQHTCGSCCINIITLGIFPDLPRALRKTREIHIIRLGYFKIFKIILFL